MRWIRLGVVALLALAPASLLVTQARAGESAKYGAAAKSPEEMAKKTLNKWQKTLKITPEQAPQFEAAMTESYRKMAEAKTAAAGDKTKMKESMVIVLKEREEALAQVLTEDQMKIYKEKIAKVSKKAKSHMAKTDDTK